MSERLYKTETERTVTGVMAGSENGHHFWVEMGEDKFVVDGSEFADFGLGIPGVRDGDHEAIKSYREKMRSLVGKQVTVVVQETETKPGIFRVTDLGSPKLPKFSEI